MIMTKVVMRKEVFSRIHLIIEISLKIHVTHYFSTNLIQFMCYSRLDIQDDQTDQVQAVIEIQNVHT